MSKKNISLYKQFSHTFGDSIYNLFGDYANFWSASQTNSDYAYNRNLGYYNALVYRGSNLKDSGYSVRCVRN